MNMVEAEIENIFKVADRSDWRSYKFGEIATNISERVEPSKSDAEIYVGLEHLDPDSIHIRRFGTPSDVEGTKLKVYKGDIIFGRRRAYQRKAAIAEFNGICSAHSMVLRANPRTIEPDLFPFFIHSDVFMNRAVAISEGSLSPTIKWKSLSEQEFRLPPRPLQKKIAETLCALDCLNEKSLVNLDKLNIFYASFLNGFISKFTGEKLRLSDIYKFQKGKNPKGLQASTIESVPYCTTNYLRSGLAENFVSNDKLSDSIMVDESDIIILWDGSNAGEIFMGKKGVLASTMCKLIPTKQEISKKFIYYFLVFKSRDIRKSTQGSAVPHVNPSYVGNLEIPILGEELEERIVHQLEIIESAIKSQQNYLTALKVLQKILINFIGTE